MTRDEALKKIQKCMALGRSAETHEAAAAMRQAQKLMAEFAVSDNDLTLINIKEARARASSVALTAWEAGLAHMVAGAFGCEQFGDRRAAFNDAGNYVVTRFYVFVGTESAPDVASYAFEVLSRQCAKARLAHIKKQPRNCKAITKTARGDEFAKGWVAAVSDLVERFAQPVQEEALLIAYMQAKHPDLKTVSTRDTTRGRKLDMGHAQAGFRAGQRAELAHGLAGAAERKLLT